MTTFQDPPLQSRRAARENASNPTAPNTADEAAPAPASSTAPSAPLAPEPLNYSTTSRPPLPQYDGQSLRPRRSAETPGHADLPPTEALPAQDAASYRPKDFSPEGRRAAAPNWAPQYDPSAGVPAPVDQPPASAPAAAAAPVAPAMEASAVSEGTMTRRELRALREANDITATAADQTAVVPPSAAAPAAASPAPVAASPAPVAAAPVAPLPPALVEPPPLVEPPALIEPAAFVAPVAPAPQPSTRLDSALAEFDALAAGREPNVPAADAPTPLPGRRAAQQPAPVAETAPPVFPLDLALDLAPAPQAAAQVAPQDAPLPPAPVAEVTPFPVAPAQIALEPTAPFDGLSAFDALFAAPSDELPELVIEPEPEAPVAPAAPQLAAPQSAAAQLLAPPPVAPLAQAPAPYPTASHPTPPYPTPPYPTPVDLPAPTSSGSPASGPGSVGHWSTQSEIDDAEQINETTISRSVGVGNGAITTSALVLPSVPEHTLGGAMSASGEILLTGSISLPQSLSMTGAHPSQLDESDLDHLLDPGDQQVSNTDSTPVRASSAISTHTATGGIIAPQKPKGTRGFTILIIAASAMAIVVVGLLIAGLVSGAL